MKGEVKVITQRGPNWNAKVDNEWYGHGKQEPKFKKGDIIEFEVTMNGRWANFDVNSIKVLSSQAPTNRGSASSASGENWDARAKYWDEKEKRDIVTQQVIQLQASRNAAIAAAKVLVDVGAFKLPAKDADKYDAVMALIDTITERYEMDSAAVRDGAGNEVAEEETETGNEYD